MVHTVDANQPPIIVKVHALKIGALLYEQYTGDTANAQQDVIHMMTDEEAFAMTRWSQALEARQKRCVH